ncbi:MAG: glycoside hydrolase family 16 protein [Cytophagales bacterium]|nr:glycoside hydrolase family 16 protein [Cytophagales bacterium]
MSNKKNPQFLSVLKHSTSFTVMGFIFFLLVFAFVSCKTIHNNTRQVYVQEEHKDASLWKVVWQDNFNGAELDSTKWTRVPQGPANWRDQMTDKDDRCFAMKSGKLSLLGIRNKDNPIDNRPYLTGGIYSKGKFAFQYGRIEVRARLESAQGAWPAIWMLPEAGNAPWPQNGEIDIMEHLNFDNFVYQTIHSNYTQYQGGKEDPPHSGKAKIIPDGFNTYALEWYPDRLVFLLNGEATFTYPKVEKAGTDQWPFDRPFYVIISQQLGGDWVGEVDLDDLPVKMEVDWVKVYQ